MLFGEIIAVCSEIHTKDVNKAESYYRLRWYREKNTALYFTSPDIIGHLWNSVPIVLFPAICWRSMELHARRSRRYSIIIYYR
jgi:hypothetical protein